MVDSFSKVIQETLDELTLGTRNWWAEAARGETGWICSDCQCIFPEGMPDTCAHGHSRCTELIQRDKEWAFAELAKENK